MHRPQERWRMLALNHYNILTGWKVCSPAHTSVEMGWKAFKLDVVADCNWLMKRNVRTVCRGLKPLVRIWRHPALQCFTNCYRAHNAFYISHFTSLPALAETSYCRNKNALFDICLESQVVQGNPQTSLCTFQLRLLYTVEKYLCTSLNLWHWLQTKKSLLSCFFKLLSKWCEDHKINSIDWIWVAEISQSKKIQPTSCGGLDSTRENKPFCFKWNIESKLLQLSRPGPNIWKCLSHESKFT